MRICPELPIARDEDGLMVAGRGDDHLVGRIAVKGRRQLAAFEDNRRRQLGEHQPGHAECLIDPELLPDLTTLGKYIGGGMSFGAFGGARRIMDIYDPRRRDALPHAGTFNNNVLTMAAGAAGLSRVFTPEAAIMLNRRGDTLRTRLNEFFRDTAASLQATGLGSLMNLHATTKPVKCPDDLAGSNDRVKELLFFDLLEEGYYVARRGFVALSLAVTDGDLDGFAAAVARFVSRHRTEGTV